MKPSFVRHLVPRALTVGVAVCWALCQVPAEPAPVSRPNILFLFSDDHAVRAIGAYGSILNQTPQMDRIAQEGALFANSFCANSICAPSRACVLTGKHSHRNGLMTNRDVFDGGQATFPKLLQQAGYRTAVIGKWHLKSDPTGFDHWMVYPGQGHYYNPDYRTAEGTKQISGYSVEVTTDLALDWLKQQEDSPQPFLLMCQFKAPHRTWMPGPDYLTRYQDVTFPEPPTLYDDYSGRTSSAAKHEMGIDQHMHLGYDLKVPMGEGFWNQVYDLGRMTPPQRAAWQAAYDPVNQAFKQAKLTGRDLVGWKYQRYLQDYLRCIDAVDDNIGRLLDYLDDAGLAKNTLVVYSSDQGFYLGEHGWFDKRWMYEESFRMPLMMRWPDRIPSGRTVPQLVQNIDFAPTFLEAAGVAVPREIQGKSLLPLLTGQPVEDWRESLYYHYYEVGEHAVAPHYGVRTDRYKLIHFYAAGEWELFDLKQDPQELTSVYDHPEYLAVRHELEQELARLRRVYQVEPPGGDTTMNTTYLDELDLTHVRQGWGTPAPRRTIVDQPLTLAGTVYERGLGTHAAGVIHLELDGAACRFKAMVGVDDETEGKGSIRFSIFGDGRKLFDSGVLRGGDAPAEVDLDLTGIRGLVLVSGSAGDGVSFDHADWGDAQFRHAGAPPLIVSAPREEKVLLTPPPPKAPRINGTRVVGVRPGKPMLHRIPCTGERPIRFSAQGLPEGLTLDPDTGILQGGISDRRHHTWPITLHAENPHGQSKRELRIVVGETLALTPPMGWNSWYIHYDRVTQEHMEAAAEAMIESGMADYGYQYVNIDDCWMKKRGDEPYRDAEGAALTNAKFPDMPAMVDRIHARGLKAGIYTSPGPWTCAGYVGAHGHEAVDAARFANWGFDFLKYDWCSYTQVATGEGRERLMRPYRVMSELLRRQDRDIVLNLCQYGMGNVWEWGGDVGGHCWRTTGDLGLQQGDLLPGFYAIGLSNARWYEHARPGQWNDPDYLLLGWVGNAHGMGEGQPTTLTGNEQYAYMSMWSLMAAPLIFSGDMAKLDPFTLNVLCNHEVIDVNQDPLGRQARIVRHSEEELVLAKPLEDGSLAVGLFNLAEVPRAIQVTAEELGVVGPRQVRDLWRQRDLGRGGDTYTAPVPRHGVHMIRLAN